MDVCVPHGLLFVDSVGSRERGDRSGGPLGQSVVVAIGAAVWLVLVGSKVHATARSCSLKRDDMTT